ncbi:THO complex subunit 7, partial [Lunasporangiospora selenospora]
AIIRARLGVNERPVRRLTSRFLKWSGSLAKAPQQELNNGLQSLHLEIAQFELGLTKTQLVTEMAEREKKNYDQEQQEIGFNISQSQTELEQLARQLEEAKQERANKIQYDEITKELSKLPSRESSQESINALRTEILDLEKDAIQQLQLMELRKKQFYTALLCLRSIQDSIHEDQREEERKLFLKRAPMDDEDDEDEDDHVQGNGDEEANEGNGLGTNSSTAASSMEGVIAASGLTPSAMDMGAASMIGQAPSSTIGTPNTNGIESVLSQEHANTRSERGSGSNSPALSWSNALASGGGNGGSGAASVSETGVFVVDLIHSSSPTIPSGMQSPAADTPGRHHSHHHPSPSPPSRSQTGTPNPDSSM